MPSIGPTPAASGGPWLELPGRAGRRGDLSRGATALVLTAGDAPALGPLLERSSDEHSVAEVVVVASGGGDQAVAALPPDPATPIRVFAEQGRSGKPAAINAGFERARCAWVVLVGGDTMPAVGALDLLVAAVRRPGVAMAGGRPVPVDPPDDLLGFAGHMIWRLHDRVARRHPKLGELVAIRREAFEPLPATAADEAYLQARTEAAGWRGVYVPEAVVANRSPRSVGDLFRQRRRIHGGHLALARTTGYEPPTQRARGFVRDLGSELVAARRPLWSAATLAIEGTARAMARWDSLRGKEQYVWTIIESAKLAPPHTDRGVDGRRSDVASLGLAAPDADQPDDQRELPM